MKEIKRYFSGAKWEPIVGYCRAIKVGNTVEVSGTTAFKDGEIVGKGDATLQTETIFHILNETLTNLGSGLDKIIRTRIYIKYTQDWEKIGLVHGKYLGSNPPASTMVQCNMIDPDILVEIEATATI